MTMAKKHISKKECGDCAIWKRTEWIPVSERLPETYEWVLVAWEEHSTGFRGVPKIAELRRNECWGFQEEMPMEYLDDLDIIAWKPIEPYTGDKEQI